jgi:hypothetical protein
MAKGAVSSNVVTLLVGTRRQQHFPKAEVMLTFAESAIDRLTLLVADLSD